MKAIIKKLFFSALLAGVLLASCSDIFETDITREKLSVLAPTDSVVLVGNEVSFFWEPVAGAAMYHLQVARPSFAEAKKIVLDTLLSANSFSYTFRPAWYEWRLRAENSGYATDYHYARFQIDTSSDIRDYKVVLLTPKPKHETQSASLSFSWEPLDLADSYVFQLEGADTSIYQSLEQTILEVELKVSDGAFSWMVLAVQEASGKKAVSDLRTFRIDNTPPALPKLLLPANQAVFTTQELINFEWEAMADKDLDFKEYWIRVFLESDPDNPILLQQLTETKAGFFGPEKPLAVGAYLWEIQTVDRLGNRSEWGTQTRSFQVQ